MKPNITHSYTPSISHKAMGTVTCLTLFVVIVELTVGYFANSLAIISDAGHNFADALAIASSWYAMWVSEKASDTKRTYGYHRTGVIAAFINSLILAIMAISVCWEAYHRFNNPQPVEGKIIIIMALVAASINIFNSSLLHKASKQDINIKSAFLHALGDVVTSVGVIIAGTLIILTNQPIIDSIVSFLVGMFIFWSSIGILRDSIDILMEGTPAHIDMEVLEKAINDIPGVASCYDLHVWSISSNIISCSFHIITTKESLKDSQFILRKLESMLANNFNITHTTIQIEMDYLRN